MRRRSDNVLWALMALGAAACGGSGDDSGGGGQGGTGASGGTLGDGGPYIDVVQTGDGAWDGKTCAAEARSGQVFPLDMYIMMDQSGSMVSKIDAQQTISKWSAATSGLGSFFDAQSAASADLGVGIQFFPLPVVPIAQLPTCSGTVTNECGTGKYCVQTGDQHICMASCATPSDCGSTQCVPAGSSANVCANDSCTASDYAAPEVAIGPLGQIKSQVLASMSAHVPMMYTPTGPALQGAVQYAKSYAPSHPDRKIAVVLATDGLPTECPAEQTTDQLIAQVKQIAADGLAGSPSIRTFVIGVVHFGDTASVANLHAIAAAGGTTEALIVEPQQDMAAQFEQALVQVKGEALGCEYKIPAGDGGKPDFGKVNIVFSINGGAEQTIYHVADASHCDASLGGWYYDKDPAQAEPTSIFLCQQSCSQFQTTGQKTDLGIQIGCETQDMPPK